MTPSPSEFDPKLEALERELEELRPCRPSDALLEQLASSISSVDANRDLALEQELESMHPAPVSASLLARINSALVVEAEEQPAMPANVVSMPQWREFMPIFRVAAVIAVMLGVLAMWMTPPAGNQNTVRTNNTESPAANPTLDLQYVSDDSIPLGDGVEIHNRRFRTPDKVTTVEYEYILEPTTKAY